MTRPRILHCIPSLTGGGAERQLVYLSQELVRLGWDVHIATVKEGPNLALLASSQIALHRLTATSKYDPRLFGTLGALVWRLEPDIIQTWIPKMDIAGGVVASLLRKRWIIAERTAPEGHPNNLRSRVRKYLARAADAVIANSAGGASYWNGTGTRVRIIRNSIPFQSINSAVPVADLPETAGKRVVLFVGRLEPEKNPIAAVEALAYATASDDTAAVMLGEGSLLGEVEKAIRRLGAVGRIIPLGYSHEVWSWMKRADILLSMSRHEGHPNAVLEAMATGCSIVLSDIAAHREMLDDHSAYFVDGNDPVAAGEKICEVLRTTAQARRRATMGPATTSALSGHEIASQYHSEYLKILSGAHDSRSERTPAMER